jgi:transcriptional regulator with XRE-family HTH domain
LEVLKINPIKTYRLKNPNVTQQQIADKVGINRAYVGMLENGKRGIAMKPKLARKIAAAIGCDWQDFYKEDNDAETENKGS